MQNSGPVRMLCDGVAEQLEERGEGICLTAFFPFQFYSLSVLLISGFTIYLSYIHSDSLIAYQVFVPAGSQLRVILPSRGH